MKVQLDPELVRARRRAIGRSQVEAAEVGEVTRSTLSRVEQGEEVLSRTALAIARGLDLDSYEDLVLVDDDEAGAA